MNLRDHSYEIEFKTGSFQPFEQRVIASGLCDVVVPMSFFNTAESELARYDCSGYISISDMDKLSTDKVFEILSKTLTTYSKASEFFINPKKMRLNLDTVYYHMKTKKVRIAYVPEDDLDVNLRVKLFAEALSCKGTEEAMAYIDRIFEGIDNYNFKLSDLATYIMHQRKKICGIIEQ